MATLTNTKIKDTYDGLLKTNDNGVLGGTSKEITDGLGNGSGIYIGTNERLGVGSSSPVSKLTLEGERNTNTLTFRTTNNDSGWTSGDEFGAIEFYSNDSSGGSAGVMSAISCFTTQASGSSSELSFSTSTFGARNVERMRIDSSGNVSIASGILELAAQAKIIGSSDNLKISADPNNVSGGSTIEFLVDGSEKMRIDSSGRVGIGTSSAIAKAHIQGGDTIASLTDWNTKSNTAFSLANPAVRIGVGYNASDNPLIQGFDTSNEARNIGLQVYGGNVGIGTDNASNKLTVNSSTVNVGIKVKSTDAGSSISFEDNTTNGDNVQVGASGDDMYFIAGGNERMRITSGGFVTVGGQTSTRLVTTLTENDKVDLNAVDGTSTERNLTFSTGSTEKMRIASNGNIGIGTTNPSAKFSVVQPTANSEYASMGSGGTVDRHLKFSGFVAGGTNNVGHRLSSLKAIALNVNGTDALYIDDDNNVGIGTSNPTGKLTVFNGAIDLFPDAAGNGYGTRLDTPFNGSSAYDFTISTRKNTATWSERMRITSDGDVGISTTSAAEANEGLWLYTQGIYLSKKAGTGTNTHCIFQNNAGVTPTTVGTIQSTGSSTSYNTSSDYRLKEDWQPMANALDRVDTLKPVNFAWKADGSRVDGFLAHELQEVIPEAVTGEKDATEEYEIPAVLDEEGNVIEEAVMGTRDVYQGIDQSKIVPLLVAAIQELKGLVQSQQAEIELLKN